MEKIIALAIGSLAGGFARYYLSGYTHRVTGMAFPYGTLVVNLIGCFLIGIFYSLSEGKALLGPNARILLMVGFCGAFTTFSTFMLETANLMTAGAFIHAILNVTLSLVFGFLVFRLGVFLGALI